MLAIWGMLDILRRTGLTQYFRGYIWMLGSRLTSREVVKSPLLADFTSWKRAYHQLNYFRANLKIQSSKKAGWLTKNQSQLFLSYTVYILDQVKKVVCSTEDNVSMAPWYNKHLHCTLYKAPLHLSNIHHQES